MSRSRASFRVVTVLFATLQLLLPGLASFADARAERESLSPGAVAHLESAGGHHCPAVHADDCVLCQFLTAPRFGAGRGPVSASPGDDGSGPSAIRSDFPGAVALGPQLPRAPPAD